MGFGEYKSNTGDMPGYYLDSPNFDWLDNLKFWEKNSFKYGVGIIRPHKMDGKKYQYWVGLTQLKDSLSDFQTILRFRLNIDLAAAKKFGYQKDTIDDDFDLGEGWEGRLGFKYGYRAVDVKKNYSDQEIGENFSFAIIKYDKSEKQVYSDFMVLDGMEGNWCQERGGSPFRVNSAEECFGTCPQDAQCFQNGNTYHIIHPDYRCSNNLCWDNNNGNTETNCLDGTAWYEIVNGNVFGERNYRNSDMCYEVYGGNGNTPPQEEILSPGHTGSGGFNDMKGTNH